VSESGDVDGGENSKTKSNVSSSDNDLKGKHYCFVILYDDAE
jgi:hypothetical protein